VNPSAIAAVFAAALCAASLARAELVAERISDANFAAFSIGGPDSIGGVGDWYLANDLVEVIVDDPARRFGKLNYGGTLVAAGVPGRPGDGQFARIFPIVNMDQRVQLNYDALRVEREPDGSAARLVVSSQQGMSTIERGAFIDPLVPDSDEIAQVFPETLYEVRPGEPFVRITTRLENRSGRSVPIFAYGEAWMRGGRGPHGFVGNTLDPELSSGFHHRDFDRARPLTAISAMTPATFIAVSGIPPWPPITYAITSPERVARGLRSFGVTSTHIHLMSTFVEDPGWAELGYLRMAEALTGEIPAGEALVYERRLVVTPGPDVASATDVVFPLLGFADGSSGVTGRIEPAEVRAVIHVQSAAGHPVTQITSQTSGPEAGRYRAILPPGEYGLIVRTPHREERRLSAHVAAGGFFEVPVQRYAPTGFLLFDPAFSDGGAGRVLVHGLDGTPDPRFDPEMLDFRLDGTPVKSGIEHGELHLVGGAARRVPIAPGRYRLTATRGIEFDVEESVVDVPESAAEVRVEPFALPRLIDLEDALVADLHVHAEASDDSGMSNVARLRSFLAEHVDVLVSTDHDHLGNYADALAELRAGDRIRVIGGVEVTGSTPSAAAPYTVGHHNAWPIPYRPNAHRKGAPPSQAGGVADLYAMLRETYGARVLQLNHALPEVGGEEEERDGSYLMHLGRVGDAFDPSLPIHAEPNRALLDRAAGGDTRAIDFDAMEVMNGLRYSQFLRLREVWYALQRQGFRRSATGNSDTHAPSESAGYPRNYVYTSDHSGGEGFDAAIREGRLFATTGPLLVAFRANGGGMGDTVAAPAGRVKVALAVAAAPWVPVEEVRLLRDGEVVRRFRDLAPGDDVLRLEREVDLVLERDAFLTLEAGAPLDAETGAWAAAHAGLYTRLAPGAVSTALSNPIYVDVDGDGRSRAPGLAPARASGQLFWRIALVAAFGMLWWWLRRRSLAAPRAG